MYLMKKHQLDLKNRQIFLLFLQLGCISFGGPAAHLVLFHRKFVQQLKWLTEAEYTQIVAFTQILPGPSSSQVGIAIGYLKKGYLGSICAWLGFSLPSCVLMTLAAMLGQYYFDQISAVFFHVIQLVVLAIVIGAFWQMLQSFCKEIWQYLFMLLSALFIYSSALSYSQFIVILFAALLGLIFSHSTKTTKPSPQTFKGELGKKNKKSDLSKPDDLYKTHQKTYIWLVLFILPFLFFSLTDYPNSSPIIQSIRGFYYSASMVFGGGHIILPLLHQEFVITELVLNQQFDLGYALAQLMPGPLFSFASYLGALLHFTQFPVLNAMIATFLIFLPSFLLIWGTLPYWSWLIRQEKIRQAITGINAAVIGLLLSLVIQMSEKSVLGGIDLIFVGLVVLLLRTQMSIVLILLGSSISYYSFLTYLNSIQ